MLILETSKRHALTFLFVMSTLFIFPSQKPNRNFRHRKMSEGPPQIWQAAQNRFKMGFIKDFFLPFFSFFYKPVKISRIRKLTTWKINCPMRVQPLKRLSGLDAEHFDLSAEIWPGEFDISWEKNTNIQYLAFINVRIRVKVIWEPLSLIDIV